MRYTMTEHLASNNKLLSQLKSQSEIVKGQATHTGVGFPLRRFNIDIDDGQCIAKQRD